MSENKLSHLKPLIRNGTIAVFGQLLDHVSLKDLAETMGCSPKHVRTVAKDSGKLRLKELFELSEALGMDYKRVSDLFCE